MEAGTSGVAYPFRHSAVTSSAAILSGAVDLKVAAAFYDRIKIIELDVFDTKLPEFLGPDYEYLADNGIIEIQGHHAAVGMNEGEPGHEYASAIQSHITACLFSPKERGSWIAEIAGNGLSRLYAALQLRENPHNELTPIVTSSLRWDGASDAIRLDRTPLPDDSGLEELLPVRATATRVIFNKLPMPGRDTPWDDILSFREAADTGLYAAQLRILLKRLGKEDDRRHVADLIETEFAAFEKRLEIFKKSKRHAKTQMVLPWMDVFHGLVKAVALAKPSEAALPYVQMEKQQIEISTAEQKITSDPYYMIEHVRSQLGWAYSAS